MILEVVAVQSELELAWQEFESASTYAYAHREALTKMKRLKQNRQSFILHNCIFFLE